MQRWQCRIYNGTLKSFFLNFLISFVVSLQKWHAHFLLMRDNAKIIRIKHFKTQNSDIVIFAIRVTWKITLTVPLTKKKYRVKLQYSPTFFKSNTKRDIGTFKSMIWVQIVKRSLIGQNFKHWPIRNRFILKLLFVQIKLHNLLYG